MFYRNVVEKSSENSDEFSTTSNFLFSLEIGGNPSKPSDDVVVRRNLRRNSACFLVVEGWATGESVSEV